MVIKVIGAILAVLYIIVATRQSYLAEERDKQRTVRLLKGDNDE